jgi:hypothetical protein
MIDAVEQGDDDGLNYSTSGTCLSPLRTQPIPLPTSKRPKKPAVTLSKSVDVKVIGSVALAAATPDSMATPANIESALILIIAHSIHSSSPGRN